MFNYNFIKLIPEHAGDILLLLNDTVLPRKIYYIKLIRKIRQNRPFIINVTQDFTHTFINNKIFMIYRSL